MTEIIRNGGLTTFSSALDSSTPRTDRPSNPNDLRNGVAPPFLARWNRPLLGQVSSAILVLLALVACGKGDGAAGGAGGGNPRDAVIAAWKKGGLTPSPLTAATVDVGKDCQSGTVGAIDVLLCVFPSADEAKAAEEAGLAWVGNTTGAAKVSGAVLIGVADRRKSDPSGRTINQLLKLAPN